MTELLSKDLRFFAKASRLAQSVETNKEAALSDSILIGTKHLSVYFLLCSSHTIFTCAQVEDFCHDVIGHSLPWK